MDREDALRRLCLLGGMVADRQFGWSKAADCICDHGRRSGDSLLSFDFSEEVLSFIEAAVEARLTQNGK